MAIAPHPDSPPPRELPLAARHGTRSAWRGLRSASSRSTSSTTGSCSRIRERRPSTTSSAASSHSRYSSLRGRSTLAFAPGRVGRSRSSPASSAFSPARRRCTTRSRSALRATTTPGCCRSSPGSCCSVSAASRCGGHGDATTASGGGTCDGCCLTSARCSSRSPSCFPISVAYVVTHAAVPTFHLPTSAPTTRTSSSPRATASGFGAGTSRRGTGQR